MTSGKLPPASGILFSEAYAGSEFDWFAVDSNGNAGLFCSGGFGFVPDDVKANHEAHSRLVQQIDLPHFGSLKVWQDFARYGLYVYDWKNQEGLYMQVAKPTNTTDSRLRGQILQIADLPTFRHNFATGLLVRPAEF